MKTKKLLLFGLSSLVLAFTSCRDKDKDEPIPVAVAKYANGAFILNEGAMGNGNASVSFLNLASDAITNDIFMDANNRPVGDVLQSACINGDNIYLVANNSGKVEVARKSDMVSVGVIENLDGPRNMIVVNGKGYITQWGAGGNVKVINLTTNQVSKTIKVGSGCEGLINVNGKIWVANSGGYGIDSTISIIDPSTDAVTKIIKVAHNPQQMRVDKNGNVWALCSGFVEYNSVSPYNVLNQTPAKLYKLSPTSEDIITSFFISDTIHPTRMDINKTKEIIYYGGTNIYSLNINDPATSNTPFISGYFYGFNINPTTGDFYTLEAPNWTSAGKLNKYTSTGTFVKQYTVGVGPNSIIFQ